MIIEIVIGKYAVVFALFGACFFPVLFLLSWLWGIYGIHRDDKSYLTFGILFAAGVSSFLKDMPRDLWALIFPYIIFGTIGFVAGIIFGTFLHYIL